MANIGRVSLYCVWSRFASAIHENLEGSLLVLQIRSPFLKQARLLRQALPRTRLLDLIQIHEFGRMNYISNQLKDRKTKGCIFVNGLSELSVSNGEE